jgi:hypothetical protein
MSAVHGHKDGAQRRTTIPVSGTSKSDMSAAKTRKESEMTSTSTKPVNRRVTSTGTTATKSDVSGPNQLPSRSRSKSATRPKTVDDVPRANVAGNARNRGMRPSSSVPYARISNESKDEREKTKVAQQIEEEILKDVSVDDAINGTDYVDADRNDNVDEVKIVEFQIPDKKDAEEFEAAAFLNELRLLTDCLQSVLHCQLVDDLEAEKLNKMVLAVTGTLGNFKAYTTRVQTLLETIRDQMKSVGDLVFKMVLQPALAERGLDHSQCHFTTFFLPTQTPKMAENHFMRKVDWRHNI